MVQENSRQLVVVGAGPGGYAAAFAAADLGIKVTLIDPEDNPGGICLYRGCIPSKTLLHLAKVIRDAADVRNCGVEFTGPAIDVDKMRAHKDAVVKKLTAGLGQLCKLRKIEYVQGTASFVNSNMLVVRTKPGQTQRIPCEKAILATGASAVTIPNIPTDSPLVMDSTNALELDSIPQSMLVIGGGYIGLELASVYAALGTNVSVVEMTPNLMPGTDPELVSVLAKRL
ncbi:MAG: FAD-dependent oxidoreductase, partial [Planctomycetota bacterium]